MSAWMPAVIFGALGVVAALAIRRDLRTGVSGDGLYRFGLDEHPLGYAVLIAGKAFVAAYGLAAVLHALGLVGDPHAAVRDLVDSLRSAITAPSHPPR
ncbi:hypothetical protein ACIKT0_07225 [Hansschlegelia beijingensis]|uniref:hypothetical protein n=1 Tax=Hansschlegelia beijingensis TaxID=1133344 RepID=UPI00387F2393